MLIILTINIICIIRGARQEGSGPGRCGRAPLQEVHPGRRRRSNNSSSNDNDNNSNNND